MGFLQKMREFVQPRRSTQPPQKSPESDKGLAEGKEKSDQLDHQKKEHERSARNQQKAREQEQAKLDKEIDQMLSDDSEKFLENTVQPGGE